MTIEIAVTHRVDAQRLSVPDAEVPEQQGRHGDREQARGEVVGADRPATDQGRYGAGEHAH